MLIFEIFTWLSIGLTLGLLQYWFNLWRGTPSQVGAFGAIGATIGGVLGKTLDISAMDVGEYSSFAFLLSIAFAVIAQAFMGKVLHRFRPAN